MSVEDRVLVMGEQVVDERCACVVCLQETYWRVFEDRLLVALLNVRDDDNFSSGDVFAVLSIRNVHFHVVPLGVAVVLDELTVAFNYLRNVLFWNCVVLLLGGNGDLFFVLLFMLLQKGFFIVII